MAANTYSFLDVQATLSGPGGSISLGAGAGAAEEGITVDMKEDKNDQKIGADGTVMNTLRASNAARITIRLLKTSPVNAQLSQLYNFQRASAGQWGQNVMVVSDVARGDIVTGGSIAFARQPSVTWAKDGNFNEWNFDGVVDMLLGTGQPDVNV